MGRIVHLDFGNIFLLFENANVQAKIVEIFKNFTINLLEILMKALMAEN